MMSAVEEQGATNRAMNLQEESRGRYEILRVVNRGGMGEIALGRVRGTKGFEKLVVLKRLRADAERDDHVAMFDVEQELMSRIEHPNIVKVFDQPIVENVPYLAMEYVRGRNLDQITRQAKDQNDRLSLAFSLTVVAEVLRGLAFVHRLKDNDGRALGVVHQDITPSNIMVSFFGEVKITDFGISYVTSRDGGLRQGVLKGKPRYVAPEVLAGKRVNNRADIYGVGLVLYEMLTQTALFARPTVKETLAAVARGELPDFALVFPTLGDGVHRLFARSLAKDPNDRYRTAEEMGADVLAELAKVGGAISPARVGYIVRQYFRDDPDVPEADPSFEEALSAEAQPVLPSTFRPPDLSQTLSELDRLLGPRHSTDLFTLPTDLKSELAGIEDMDPFLALTPIPDFVWDAPDDGELLRRAHELAKPARDGGLLAPDPLDVLFPKVPPPIDAAPEARPPKRGETNLNLGAGGTDARPKGDIVLPEAHRAVDAAHPAPFGAAADRTLDRAAADRAAADRAAADRAAADRAAADRAAVDRAAADRVVTDRVVTDRAVADRVLERESPNALLMRALDPRHDSDGMLGDGRPAAAHAERRPADPGELSAPTPPASRFPPTTAPAAARSAVPLPRTGSASRGGLSPQAPSGASGSISGRSPASITTGPVAGPPPPPAAVTKPSASASNVAPLRAPAAASAVTARLDDEVSAEPTARDVKPPRRDGAAEPSFPGGEATPKELTPKPRLTAEPRVEVRVEARGSERSEAAPDALRRGPQVEARGSERSEATPDAARRAPQGEARVAEPRAGDGPRGAIAETSAVSQPFDLERDQRSNLQFWLGLGLGLILGLLVGAVLVTMFNG